MNTDAVLLLHMNIFQASQVKAVLNSSGYRCIICSQEDEKRRVQELFQSASAEDQQTKGKDEAKTERLLLQEALIIIGTYSVKDRDTILALLKEAGAGGILKAVLTGTNGSWTVEKLYAELTKERALLR